MYRELISSVIDYLTASHFEKKIHIWYYSKYGSGDISGNVKYEYSKNIIISKSEELIDS